MAKDKGDSTTNIYTEQGKKNYDKVFKHPFPRCKKCEDDCEDCPLAGVPF